MRTRSGNSSPKDSRSVRRGDVLIIDSTAMALAGKSPRCAGLLPLFLDGFEDRADSIRAGKGGAGEGHGIHSPDEGECSLVGNQPFRERKGAVHSNDRQAAELSPEQPGSTDPERAA